MSAGSITSAAALSQPASQTNRNAFAELDSQEFIRIITTELTNQDPLSPNDTTAILEQLSSLRNIEAQTSLENSMQDLVDQNALASAGGLIGGFVEGLDASGRTVSGTVKSLRIEDGKGIYVLDNGARLPAQNATAIRDAGSLDPDAVQQLLQGMLLNGSASLIGKTVSGTTAAGQAFSGQVAGLGVTDDGIELDLDNGSRVKAEWVTALK